MVACILLWAILEEVLEGLDHALAYAPWDAEFGRARCNGETFASNAPSEASSLDRYVAGDERSDFECESHSADKSQADAVEFCHGGLVSGLVGCSGTGFGSEDTALGRTQYCWEILILLLEWKNIFQGVSENYGSEGE